MASGTTIILNGSMNHLSMRTLARHISNLLFEHDCVIVPGLGGFITNYKPTSINAVHNTFNPPSKQVTFNVSLDTNDGMLAHAIAGDLNIEYSEASKLIEKEVRSIKVALLKGQKVTMDQIGYLLTNRENNIQFVPSNAINYLGESYGLNRFTANPIIRPKKGINRPAIRKTARWAAVLLPLASIALWSALNTNTIVKGINNYASMFPTSVESGVPAPQPKVENKTIEIPVVESKAVTAIEQPTIAPVVVADTYFIIAGAFEIQENAQKLVEKLNSNGYNASIVGQNRRNLHMVSIQSFNNKEMATSQLSELHGNGFPSAWLLKKVD